MNRGYNLLAFPHGGYLIREKGGVDTREDNGPSEALNEGRERERCSHERTELEGHTDQKAALESNTAKCFFGVRVR